MWLEFFYRRHDPVGTAAVAAGFSIFTFSYFVSMPLALSQNGRAALILALTLVNYRGCENWGATVQNIFHLEIARLVMLIGSMFVTGGRGIPQPPLQPSAFQRLTWLRR